MHIMEEKRTNRVKMGQIVRYCYHRQLIGQTGTSLRRRFRLALLFVHLNNYHMSIFTRV